ncbi:zinc finger SWIM domain-containing protein 7 [Polypterus senegalus]|uniref:zinc finger SWIM domain-containing protein 7 n=1 Tax=Polypterus senegalus TaxID=55291 RepID=UPI001963FC5E|nr:zinc finger SWIM domain-containing protein 7 [Polypterus senegalus]
MTLVLPAVAKEILGDVKKAYEKTSKIPDELLLALKFVFGPLVLLALDLVDQRAVTNVTSPSGRKVIQVMGSSGRLYTCYVACLYCPCPAFAFSVLQRNDGLLCKHILATLLSEAMGLCRTAAVSDQQMTEILLEKEED